MTGVHCDEEEEGNHNMPTQGLVLNNNQQADAIDCYLQQRFHSA